MEVPAVCKAPRHSHPCDQFVQVLAGGGIIETEAGCREFRAGSVLHFPPGTWHAAEMATETVLIEMNLQAPGE